MQEKALILNWEMGVRSWPKVCFATPKTFSFSAMTERRQPKRLAAWHSPALHSTDGLLAGAQIFGELSCSISSVMAESLNTLFIPSPVFQHDTTWHNRFYTIRVTKGRRKKRAFFLSGVESAAPETKGFKGYTFQKGFLYTWDPLRVPARHLAPEGRLSYPRRARAGFAAGLRHDPAPRLRSPLVMATKDQRKKKPEISEVQIV